jgi:hypothetical protein
MKIIASVLAASVLAACNPVASITDAQKQANAVAAELEAATGVKPGVGHNWSNGKLTSVSVIFPRPVEAKTSRELADAVRSAVAAKFASKPDGIIVGFVVPPESAPQAALAQ